jgi:hypothetical protein
MVSLVGRIFNIRIYYSEHCLRYCNRPSLISFQILTMPSAMLTSTKPYQVAIKAQAEVHDAIPPA